MVRVVFENNKLREYLSIIKSKHHLTHIELAQFIGVDRHTLNDWQRGKFLPQLEKLRVIETKFQHKLPQPTEIRLENWDSARAAITKNLIYGCTLTKNDRAKGGHNSQVARKANPEYYRQLGCNVHNDFKYPYHTPQFAELIGILLGDGHIDNNGQFSITLNTIADKQYIHYVIRLLKTLFNYQASVHKKKNCNAVSIYVSGKDAITFLIKSGLKTGNKVKQQVDVPDWIKVDPDLSRWCLRGLMDTDGGVFTNPYVINGKSYTYPKTNFTNASQPLLDFVYQTLQNNGFHPNNKVPRKIWLYSQKESKKYIETIGSSNYRLLRKFQ